MKPNTVSLWLNEEGNGECLLIGDVFVHGTIAELRALADEINAEADRREPMTAAAEVVELEPAPLPF